MDLTWEHLILSTKASVVQQDPEDEVRWANLRKAIVAMQLRHILQYQFYQININRRKVDFGDSSNSWRSFGWEQHMRLWAFSSSKWAMQDLTCGFMVVYSRFTSKQTVVFAQMGLFYQRCLDPADLNRCWPQCLNYCYMILSFELDNHISTVHGLIVQKSFLVDVPGEEW